jgi:thiol-disulfide isomerase/thioredoxin
MKSYFLVIFCLLTSSLQAQPGYVVHDRITDFPIEKIINTTVASSFFNQLNDRLLIIDFFGTWCVPCVKALPGLSALQDKYKDQIRVVLISSEPEIKLTAFFNKQKNFTLPVIVDEQERVINKFQPPAYPYTVIVGRGGKVIAIPNSEELVPENIDKWLGQQEKNIESVMTKTNQKDTSTLSSGVIKPMSNVIHSENKLVQLSQDFMYAAKTGDETSDFISRLKQIEMDELQLSIKTDHEKKAFWINLYNAYTQVALKENPAQYKNRGRFFGNKFIQIAGHSFSLDDIEHGILRRSKVKWSLGYFNKLFPGKMEKLLRVTALDYRIHFALNCGAKSCPPIAFYRAEDIDKQLDIATKVYLNGEAEYSESANRVKLPALMSWFRRDFGGKKGMIALLQTLAIIPMGKKPGIQFKQYDWTLYLQNFK